MKENNNLINYLKNIMSEIKKQITGKQRSQTIKQGPIDVKINK